MSDDMNDVAGRVAMARLAGLDPPRIDPKTGKEIRRVRVRVRVRPRMQILPGSQIAYRDVDGSRDNYFEVYSDDLPKLRAMLEPATKEQLANVQAELERRERSHMEEIRAAAEQVTDPHERERLMRQRAQTSPHSFEAAFEHVMERSLLPIEEIEELSDEPKRKAA